jgi:hypothetical protein
MPKTPCLVCGKLGRGSDCARHRPRHPSPSSTLGRVPHLRRRVKARDGNRCVRCGHAGSAENPLHVHHRAEVARYGAAANHVELMETLCRACHRLVPKRN